MATCSKLPPRTPTSVCAPMGPRWRTSTPAAYFSMSLTDWTGYVAISSAVITFVMRTALGRVVLILEAVTSISSIL